MGEGQWDGKEGKGSGRGREGGRERGRLGGKKRTGGGGGQKDIDRTGEYGVCSKPFCDAHLGQHCFVTRHSTNSDILTSYVCY